MSDFIADKYHFWNYDKTSENKFVFPFLYLKPIPFNEFYITNWIYFRHCEKTRENKFVFMSLYIQPFTFDDFFQTNFEPDHVRSIVRDSIKTVVGNAPYTDSKITFWTNAIIEACLVQLTKLQKPFKYIGKVFMNFFQIIYP